MLSAIDLDRAKAPGGLSYAADRDAALIAVWYATGARASDVARLRWQDLTWETRGIIWHLARGKTDQDGHGRDVPIVGPAVRRLRAWRWERATGPVWHTLTDTCAPLTPDQLVAIVQVRAAAAGLARVTGHSFRRGHVTEARRAGVPLERIASTVGHRSIATTHRYVAGLDALQESSGHGLIEDHDDFAGKERTAP